MSARKDIKRLVLTTPNDADLGKEVRKYIDRYVTEPVCMHKDSYTEIDESEFPYGLPVRLERCTKCDKILNVKIINAF